MEYSLEKIQNVIDVSIKLRTMHFVAKKLGPVIGREATKLRDQYLDALCSNVDDLLEITNNPVE